MVNEPAKMHCILQVLFPLSFKFLVKGGIPQARHFAKQNERSGRSGNPVPIPSFAKQNERSGRSGNPSPRNIYRGLLTEYLGH